MYVLDFGCSRNKSVYFTLPPAQVWSQSTWWGTSM